MRLIVSLGPERYDVPDLAGLTRDEADTLAEATRSAIHEVLGA